MPFNSATLRVCSPREVGEVCEIGSKSNPIVISDSEPLGSPSNPIIIHYEDYDSRTHGLPVPPSTDADTENICTPEFWDGVVSDIDPGSLSKGLGLDSEAGSRASHPGSDKAPVVGQLSSEVLLDGDRRETVVSTLHESNTPEYHAEHRSYPVVSNAVSEGQAVPSGYSNSGQSQMIAQLPQGQREFQTEDTGRSDQMDDEIMQIGSPSNPIVLRNENDAESENAREEQDSWFDVDGSQSVETGEPGPDQVEEIDLTSVHSHYNPQHTKDDILREEQSWVDESQAVEHEADIGLTEEIDLSYANASVSNPKNTEVFEPNVSEDIHNLGTNCPALQFEKPEDKH